ncbi:MAG TPA: hypothetical protein VLX92_03645 [Kofleriaceae bacterium]|nr:hypothetical protein [Kofleriaceae bacterium]
MRPFLFASIVAGAASVAAAGGMKYTPLVDVAAVDPACRVLAQTPQNATVDGPSYDAAISTANCVAMAGTRTLVLTPSADSVKALDDAEAPALAILDRVIARGDAEHALIADYAEVDLLRGNAARMLDALPPLSPQMSRNEVAEHTRQVMVTGVLIEPWLRRATKIRRDIATLVSAHPELATRDVVLANIVASTRIVEAVGLAAR